MGDTQWVVNLSECQRAYFYRLQNLFVATDFLSYSTQALLMARDLSKASCASLTCFHAIEKLPASMRAILFPYAAHGSDEVMILGELRENMELMGMEYLSAVLGEELGRVKFKVDFSRDSMAKSILHAASEVNADLMYCGSYGTKPHTTGLIGSMAATFVAYTRIPLYLIKDPTHRGRHKKILVAFIESSLSAQLLAWAVSFSMCYEAADVEIVTPIVDLRACDRDRDYQGFSVTERHARQALERVTFRARQAVQSLGVPFLYEGRARSLSFKQHAPVMSPASAVLHVADEIGADLIVLPSAQPNLFVDNEVRETSRRITEYARQNCLLIPEAFLK